ncbi:MAG: pyrophosphatase PpaX [Caldibacillus sp.]
MKDKITTVLFDLDGTLLNTYELIIQSFLHTFDHFVPGRFTREDCIPFIGPSLQETFGAILPEKTEEMVAYYREFNKKHHDEFVREFPGVSATVQTLYDQGYKLGIVTTKMKDTTLLGLDLVNLRPYFQTIIALDDVEKTKPDAEPIYKALSQLEAEPEEAIMVGDSHHDILAGKNAGTKTAGVAWTIKGKATLERYAPDYMLEKMPDLLSIVGVDG